MEVSKIFGVKIFTRIRCSGLFKKITDKDYLEVLSNAE